MDLDPKQRTLVRAILDRRLPGIEARVFGSRVQGGARAYSDLDLALVGDEPIPRRILWLLKEDFEESELRFRVDLVDWNRIGHRFRALIERGYEQL